MFRNSDKKGLNCTIQIRQNMSDLNSDKKGLNRTILTSSLFRPKLSEYFIKQFRPFGSELFSFLRLAIANHFIVTFSGFHVADYDCLCDCPGKGFGCDCKNFAGFDCHFGAHSSNHLGGCFVFHFILSFIECLNVNIVQQIKCNNASVFVITFHMTCNRFLITFLLHFSLDKN